MSGAVYSGVASGVGSALKLPFMGAGNGGAGKPYDGITALNPSLYVPSINDAVAEGVLFQDTAGTVAATVPGDPVALVKDFAGSYDLTAPSDAARPTLQIVGSDYALLFDGTDDYLTNATPSIPCATVCIAANPTGSTPSGRRSLVTNSVDQATLVDLAFAESSGSWDGAQSQGRALATNLHIYRDGVLNNAIQSTPPATHVYSADGTGATWALEFPNGVNFLKDRSLARYTSGYVYGFALFPVILSDADRGTVEAYMSGFGLGAELVTSPVVAADWSPYGSNTVTDIAGDVVEIEIVSDARGAALYFWTGVGLPIDLVAGKTYRLQVDVQETNGYDGNDRVCWWDLSSQVEYVDSTWKTHTWFFTASATQGYHYVRFQGDVSDIFQVKNISMREVCE